MSTNILMKTLDEDLLTTFIVLIQSAQINPCIEVKHQKNQSFTTHNNAHIKHLKPPRDLKLPPSMLRPCTEESPISRRSHLKGPTIVKQRNLENKDPQNTDMGYFTTNALTSLSSLSLLQ